MARSKPQHFWVYLRFKPQARRGCLTSAWRDYTRTTQGVMNLDLALHQRGGPGLLAEVEAAVEAHDQKLAARRYFIRLGEEVVTLSERVVLQSRCTRTAEFHTWITTRREYEAKRRRN